MGISVSGIGSGLDITSIVSQLMDIERQPLTALQSKEAGVQAKITAYGSIKSSLATLQNAVAGLKLPTGSDALDFYSTYQGSISDSTIGTVTAGSGTVPGNYSLEVDQLAKQNRIISAAGTTIGTGNLTISLGAADGSTTVKSTTISITDNSLTAIRDAINNANAGVSAAVINGSDGAQLVLTGDDGGSDHFINLSGVTGLNYTPPGTSTNFSQQQAAQSAEIKLNGISISSSSNTITDALDGVTLNLTKETSGTPVTLSLTRDTSSINKALEKFVSAYNDYNTLEQQLGSYDTSTQTAGTLLGDATLRGIETKMRSMLSSISSSLKGNGYTTLSDIGISFQKDGSLELDSTKLQSALDSDFAGVAKLAAAYGNSMDSMITNLIGTNGLIIGKTDGLQSTVTSLQKQQTTLEARLTQTEARLTKQYSDLDTLIASMQQTSTYLTQQLASFSSLNSRNG